MTTHNMPQQSKDELAVAKAEAESEPTDVTDVKGAFGKKFKDAAKAKAEKS